MDGCSWIRRVCLNVEKTLIGKWGEMWSSEGIFRLNLIKRENLSKKDLELIFDFYKKFNWVKHFLKVLKSDACLLRHERERRIFKLISRNFYFTIFEIWCIGLELEFDFNTSRKCFSQLNFLLNRNWVQAQYIKTIKK